jgi:hypothetical protein
LSKGSHPITTILENAPAVKPTLLTIKGNAYTISPIEPVEEGTAAFRLDKLAGDGVYDVVRNHDGLVVCDCPDYVCRHAGTASLCKHGRALIEAGMLAAPCPKPAVAPITRKDQVRASYFGLKLPAVALVEILATPAPAPIAVVVEAAPIAVVPAGWESIEAATNPRDGWPAWTDEERWTTEAPFVAEPLPAESSPVEFQDVAGSIEPSLASRLWLAETVALVVTIGALEDVEDGREDDPDRIFDRLEADNRESFQSFLKMFGGSASTWHDWLDLCWEGSPVSFPAPAYSSEDLANLTDADVRLEDEIADLNFELFYGRTRKPIVEARPTYLPRFAPTLDDDAERLGYDLGREGEPARAPKGWGFGRLVCFYGGFLAGQADLESEVMADLAWIEERKAHAFADPIDRIHPAELIEFGGSRVVPFED